MDALLAFSFGGLALATLAARDRRGWLQASAAVTGAMLLAGVATRVLPQGQMTFGLLLLLLAVVLATFLPPRTLTGYLVAFSVGFAVAQSWNSLVLGWLYVGVLVAAMVLTSALVSTLVRQQQRLTADLARQARRDPLTSAYNRRGLGEAAAVARSVADRVGNPVSVVAIDLDGFKQVNDEHGHQTGDTLLSELVSAWGHVLRASDALGRVGGDEFAVVLTNTTPGQAEEFVERLRAAHPGRWSSGITAWRRGETFWQALQRADQDLYREKTARRGAGP